MASTVSCHAVASRAGGVPSTSLNAALIPAAHPGCTDRFVVMATVGSLKNIDDGTLFTCDHHGSAFTNTLHLDCLGIYSPLISSEHIRLLRPCALRNCSNLLSS